MQAYGKEIDMRSENPIVKWTLPISLGVSIICCAILFSLHFKGLYYWEIEHLSISENAHIKQDQIKRNYNVLIDYLTDEKIERLVLPSFGMSLEGEIHFQDVKNIFTLIKKVMYISGIYSLLAIFAAIIKKQYKFLKHTAIAILAGPLGLLALAMIDFDQTFEIFHKLSFSNDYWIFDPVKDPVIMILPQDFFLHSFLLIIAIVLLAALILALLYRIIVSKKTVK